MVYWSEIRKEGISNVKIPCSKEFDLQQMTDALTFMEELRCRAVVDGLSFITMSSENPNSVGKAGVSEVNSDYSWTKRRNNRPGLRKK